MRKKNVKLALSALLLLSGISTKLNAQLTPLTKTPWIVGFGADIIDDDNKPSSIFHNLKTYQYYPAKFTAEKVIKNGWSGQLAFGSTSLNPHNFLMLDLNGKYYFMYKKTEKKILDPYGIFGLGYTYRDHSPYVKNTSADHNNTVNLNLGLGANIWLYPNMGINLQGLAKFTKDKYLQASVGLVFRIGGTKAPECTVTPKTQEAQDALQHLRGIINK